MASQILGSGQLRFGAIVLSVSLLRCAGADGKPWLQAEERQIGMRSLWSTIERQMNGSGAISMGIERLWHWRPARDADLLVWVVCRGGGYARACAVAVGKRTEGRVQTLGSQPVGWSVPQLGETADRTEIVAMGEEGHGTWRQSVRYAGSEPGGGAVRFGRRAYTEEP